MFPLQQICLISELDRCRITAALEIESCTLDGATVRAKLGKTGEMWTCVVTMGLLFIAFQSAGATSHAACAIASRNIALPDAVINHRHKAYASSASYQRTTSYLI